MINILAKMFNFEIQTFDLLFIDFFLRLEVTFQYSIKKKKIADVVMTSMQRVKFHTK